MLFLYAPPKRHYEIFLFPTGTDKLTYDQAVQCIQQMGYDPFQGRGLVFQLFELSRMKEVVFPSEYGRIVGLAQKDVLPVEKVEEGRNIYSCPTIFHSLMQNEKIGKEQFSETDAINAAGVTYIICTKEKKEKEDS